jgi:hypothetical protein
LVNAGKKINCNVLYLLSCEKKKSNLQKMQIQLNVSCLQSRFISESKISLV